MTELGFECDNVSHVFAGHYHRNAFGADGVMEMVTTGPVGKNAFAMLLFMLSLPLKMVLRWTVNLKYIISIPEYFLNF